MAKPLDILTMVRELENALNNSAADDLKAAAKLIREERDSQRVKDGNLSTFWKNMYTQTALCADAKRDEEEDDRRGRR